ncbi:MAG: hypothetical protein JXR94_24740 [Candidatus Hydrogenedentes bacterium]|nr:hypothetical protein [Candidatus Hydrogenedentota bacterium]
MADPDTTRKRVVSELDAIGRCKQCGARVTEFDKVTGPTGMFCSQECRQKHEAFIQRAEALHATHKKSYLGMVRALFRHFLGKVLALLVLLAFVAILATVFDLPVISDMVEKMGIASFIKELMPQN